MRSVNGSDFTCVCVAHTHTHMHTRTHTHTHTHAHAHAHTHTQGSYNGHPYIGDSGRQMIGMLNN